MVGLQIRQVAVELRSGEGEAPLDWELLAVQERILVLRAGHIRTIRYGALAD